MFKEHLKAIEAKLRAETDAVHINHWNNQTENAAVNSLPTPSVYIDFGSVDWKTDGNRVKTAQNAVVRVHCTSKHIRATNDTANDADGRRLNRFDWSDEVLQVLENFTARDADEKVLIKSMTMTNSELDTNHDALVHDILSFSCTLYLYSVARDRNWTEITLQGVNTERDPSIY